MAFKFNALSGKFDLVDGGISQATADTRYLQLSGLVPYFPTSEIQEKPQETILTTFQSGHGFTLTTGGGAIADDTSVYCKGSQSLKITTKGDGTQIRVTKASISPTINISGKMVRVLLKTDDPTNYLNTASQVFIGFSSDNFSSHYFYFNAAYVVAHEYGGDSWIEVGFTPSNMNTTGTPDLTAINAIRIYAKDNPVGVANLWFQSISIHDAPPEGIVSLTFDDGSTSQYTEASKKMSEYSFSGTAYVIPAQVGESGYMTLAQLKNLQDIHGWDISSHYSTNFTTLTSDELETAIKSVKNYLASNGFAKGMDHLAYPQGDYNQTVLPIVKKYFLSGRQSSTGLHETLPITDRYRIKVFPVKNTTTPAEVATQVTAAINNKDWLVLVFHKVLATTSASEDCTIADFGTIIDDIATQGIPVKTVSEVVNHWLPVIDHTKLSNIGTNTHAQIDTFITNTVKASGAEITTGTDDAKFATAKAIKDAGIQSIATTRPEDHGLLAWTYDPAGGTTSYTLATKGLAYGTRIFIPKAMTISNVLLCTAGTPGADLVNPFFAVYQNGTLLYQSGSQEAAWEAGSGLKTVAITPQAVVAGNIDLIFWCSDWTTAPTFVRGAGSALINAGLSSATLRFFTADATLTTTAPSTLGTKTALSISFWAAIS